MDSGASSTKDWRKSRCQMTRATCSSKRWSPPLENRLVEELPGRWAAPQRPRRLRARGNLPHLVLPRAGGLLTATTPITWTHALETGGRASSPVPAALCACPLTAVVRDQDLLGGAAENGRVLLDEAAGDLPALPTQGRRAGHAPGLPIDAAIHPRPRSRLAAPRRTPRSPGGTADCWRGAGGRGLPATASAAAGPSCAVRVKGGAVAHALDLDPVATDGLDGLDALAAAALSSRKGAQEGRATCARELEGLLQSELSEPPRRDQLRPLTAAEHLLEGELAAPGGTPSAHTSRTQPCASMAARLDSGRPTSRTV